MAALDWAVLAILAAALLRGLWIGMVREAFSLGALVAACFAVRFYTADAARWLGANAPELGELGARLLAGAAIGIGTAVLVGVLGRMLARVLRRAGLGPADRLGGLLVGAVEGALVVALLVFAATTLLGRDHPALRDTRTQATADRAAAWLGTARTPDVAAPARR